MEHNISCKVVDVILRTYNVKTIRLKPEVEVSYQAGQFVSFSLNKEPEFTRYLSLSSSPTEEGYIEVTKKITDSNFSKKLSDIAIDSTVYISTPMGNFTLKEDVGKIAFLAGGIGITPIRSIVKYACDKNIDIDMVLLYSNRTVQDIAFEDELMELSRKHNKFHLRNIVSEADKSWCGDKGMMCENFIKEYIKDLGERKFYLCGPPGMVTFLKKMLLEERFMINMVSK
jgi:ferredoxin-NADP reductase